MQVTLYRSSSTQFSSSSRSPKVFTEGRVCSFPSCTTMLSRYNANSVCALHSRPERPTRSTR
jgi:hypothetical protein